MTDTIGSVYSLLTEAGYSVGTFDASGVEALTFENDSILGFVLCYADSGTLLRDWQRGSGLVIQNAQFALRKAEKKAWNTYFVFLADNKPSYAETILLGAIEENLVGTRKIARAGVSEVRDLQSALLPLLPIGRAPNLEAVDMPMELRLRTSELPTGLIDAFISGSSNSTLIQLLESGQ
jgi:hypothetical protein